jgi:Fe-S-cluster-containing hydrogenase component 2
MKTPRIAIVFFSQTGNTKKVAEAILNGTMAAGGRSDLIRLEGTNIQELIHYDLIGIGCPVHFLREPFNVRVFVRKLGFLRGKHCFLFATHGGYPGNVFPSLNWVLKRHCILVIDCFDCDADDTFISHAYPWFTHGHPDGVDLKQAFNFGVGVARKSSSMSNGIVVETPKFKWLGRDLYNNVALHEPRSRDFDMQMRYVKNKCKYPKCHLCVDNCPVKAIDLSVDPLVFRNGCISCEFCERVCPTGAIQFDEKDLDNRAALFIMHYKKYNFHGFFKRAQIALIDNRSHLFRNLVGEVNLNNPNQAYYKMNTKRPRYIVGPNDLVSPTL